MKRALVAPVLLIFASHQAAAQNESSKRAYFGIQLQQGALVGDVDDNGPAQAAGIEPGDLIVSFDGKVIKSPEELSKIIAATPIGKEVPVALIRRGKEGMTTARLGQRLVLSGPALDEYRHELEGMLQELGSLGASKANWGQPELNRFSELLAQFEELRKTVPPRDAVAENLWSQLDREFRIYRPLADNIRRQREAQKDQSADSEARIDEQLGPLYATYMNLQVCAARFQQFGDVKSGFREFLKNKQTAFPGQLADKLWNTTAVKFQKVEAALDRTGTIQLYGECEQAAKQATALMMPPTGGSASEPPLRRKDF